MDDIESTLAHYKKVTRQREEEERRQELQRVKEDQQRRLWNAGRVEQHLRDVVRPVLESTQKKILAAGFSCEVESHAKRAPYVSEEEQTFALCLKMTTMRNGMRKPAWLQYAKESDGTALEVTECLGNEARPRDAGLVALDSCGPEYVERQVKEFVAAVFAV